MKAGPGLPRVIGLCGRSGAGKDVVARHLVEQFGYRRIALADHLKRVTALSFAMTDEQLWGDGRNRVDARWNRTPREVYQLLGDALRAIHPEAMTVPWRSQVDDALSHGERVVVPDIRTATERKVLKSLGGVLWRIERPAPGLTGATARHSTETSCEHMLTDGDIRNDGTIDLLMERVHRLLTIHAGPKPNPPA